MLKKLRSQKYGQNEQISRRGYASASGCNASASGCNAFASGGKAPAKSGYLTAKNEHFSGKKDIPITKNIADTGN